MFLMLFLAVSLIYISPNLRKPKSAYRSSDLQEVTIEENNTIRTDYLDENGKLTVAADKGYATKIVQTIEEGKLEAFYDDQGNPAKQFGDYYQIFWEYDENGNNCRTTYLDSEGLPILIYGGYATEQKVFNDKNRVTGVYYLGKDGEHIFSSVYGFGKLYEYNEGGKVKKITYIDETGNPVVTGVGYASLVRNYYVTDDFFNGKIESEFYFDAEGKPIALSLGQYGEHREYDVNGQESVLTYLDADGNPTVTNKGYTTVVRTFQPNNAIATEKYFDIEGKPYAMADGQYGVNMENGQARYLDENGNLKFNIRNLLYNHSWTVIIFALGTVTLSALIGKKGNWFLLFLYCGVILYMTLLFRETGGSELRLELYGAYKKIFSDSEARADILKNIWLFIPLGAILYQIWPCRWVLVIPFLLSGMIEAVQFITGTGICELIDIVNNGLGGTIGFAMSAGIKQLLSRLFMQTKKKYMRSRLK